MKKIIITFLFLVSIPTLSLGNNAAPYTDDAMQKIFKAIQETPKVEYTDTAPKDEYFKKYTEYYATVFDKAGYSFNETINTIVADMKNNPEAIPSDRQTVFNKIYIFLHIMMYECNSNKVDCLRFFPPETQQSIQWLIENSEFSTQDNAMHREGNNDVKLK